MFNTWTIPSWSLVAMLLVSATASISDIEERADEQFRPWSAAGESLCGMSDQRVAIVGNQIFFMNGNYNFVGDTAGVNKQSLYTLRLNESFSVSGLITGDQLYKSDVPSDVSWETTSGVFFYDNTTLYLYAGLADSDENASNRLWAYNVLESLWQQIPISGGDFQHGGRGSALYANVPGAGMSFLSGGDAGDTPGMLRFNSSDPASLKWENDTSFSYSDLGSPGPLRGEGELVFVPAGEQGVLISIGGYNTAEEGYEYGGGFPWNDAPMSSVDVYDIASAKWYNVETSGDEPHDRGIFSYWMTPAPDGSSYTITIYGGWNLFIGKSFEDIYVLSIPAFKWIMINDTNNIERAALNRGLGRRGHHGLKWREDSGFVLGGSIKNDTADINVRECSNSLFSPIRLLNLTSYAWLSNYDPNNTSPYRVNSQIYNAIGGGPSGGATATAPSDGWGTNTALDEIFSKQYSVPVAPTNIFAQAAVTGSSGTATSATSAGTTSQSQSGNSTSAGVIAGAVVGAVAGTALVAGAIAFFCLRRYKLQQQRQSSEVALVSTEERKRGDAGHGDQASSAVGDEASYDLPRELEGSQGATRYELDGHGRGPVELEGTARGELADSSVVQEADSKPVGEGKGRGRLR